MDSKPFSIRLLLFLDQIQDWDLIGPICRAVTDDYPIHCTVCLTQRLLAQSPRSRAEFDGLGIKPLIHHHRLVRWFGRPSSSGFDALLTAAESTVGAHAVPHALTKRANRRDLATFTMQHGFENIGLTYFDEVHGSEVRFASRHIFIWGPVNALPPETPGETRERCIAVGCPKEVRSGVSAHTPVPPLAGSEGPVVLICENLHWHRYDAAYRARFLEDMEALAEANPQVTFVIKPHHAGRWSFAHFSSARANVRIINPTDPAWEPHTAPALIAAADAVITTPSTVAVDAARLQKPVGVVSYDLDTQTYHPLPQFRQRSDWFDFVAALANPDDLLSRARRFIDRVLVPGPAARRILDCIVERTRANTAR